jgi:hypothetical protein
MSTVSKTRERVEAGERLLSLSEVAAILKMKRPNTAKFLVRRGIKPAMEKASGYFWWEADILRVKKEREADTERMASDAKRRAAALRRINGEAATESQHQEMVDALTAVDGRAADAAAKPVRLGKTQKAVLLELLRHPITDPDDSQRLALRRLKPLGYVESMDDATGKKKVWVLTDEGRREAAEVQA